MTMLDISAKMLSVLFETGYQLNYIKHQGAWSVHIVPCGVDGIDSDRVYGGTDEIRDVALAKALSEYVERQAMAKASTTFPFIADSTGFSAWPCVGPKFFIKWKTRITARFEAIERYSGYHWWADESIRSKAYELNEKQIIPLTWLDLKGQFSRFNLIQIESRGFEETLVLIGLLPKGGFTIGCAAGWRWNRQHTLMRACVELMRHFHIVKRNAANPTKNPTRYGKKLMHLSSGELDDKLCARLQINGKYPIKFPAIAFDGPIAHDFEDLYYVHRFVFEHQPDIFVDFNNIVM